MLALWEVERILRAASRSIALSTKLRTMGAKLRVNVSAN